MRRLFISTLLLPACQSFHQPLYNGQLRQQASRLSSLREGDAALNRRLFVDQQLVLPIAMSPLVATAGVHAAEEGPPTPATAPRISDRCYLDMELNGKLLGRVVVGLWGEEAPTSVQTFAQLCGKTYPGGLSYAYSAMSKVFPNQLVVLGKITGDGTKKVDKKIDETGRVRVTYTDRATYETANTDSPSTSHSSEGLVSVRRGGGTFEFGVTLQPMPDLDRDYIVIGQVLEGMDVIKRLSRVKYIPPEDLREAFRSVAKAIGDPRASGGGDAYSPVAKVITKNVGLL